MEITDLINFETNIAKIYEEGKIRAPIHLMGGNEEKLLDIVELIDKNDWVFSTHRNHYHWLISGRDPEILKQQILEGHSMHVYDDRFFSSAIVGGNAPIALGVAWALKLKNSQNRVWCFIGDAAYECGIVQESIKYAQGHDLPIVFIVEDNKYCVRAITKEIWGTQNKTKVVHYNYERKYQHAGGSKEGEEKKYVMF